jgi:tight adherence protein C
VDVVAPFLRVRMQLKSDRDQKLEDILSIKEMPFIYGLVSTALASGLGPAQCVERIAPYVSPRFSDVFSRVTTDIESGTSIVASLGHLTQNPHLRSLGFLLIEMCESGTQGKETVDALSRESLTHIRRESHKAIKKLPITMLFPLVVCVLPAFILLSVVPIVVNGLMSMTW